MLEDCGRVEGRLSRWQRRWSGHLRVGLVQAQQALLERGNALRAPAPVAALGQHPLQRHVLADLLAQRARVRRQLSLQLRHLHSRISMHSRVDMHACSPARQAQRLCAVPVVSKAPPDSKLFDFFLLYRCRCMQSHLDLKVAGAGVPL